MRFLLAAALLALGITSATANTVTISGIDPGGEVSTYDMWWKRVAESGDNVVIDGACVSACTLFLTEIPPERVCLTERAVLGFHKVSGSTNDEAMTEIYVRLQYPPWVLDLIAARGPLEDWPQFFYAEDLVPNLQMCPGHQVPTKRTYSGAKQETPGEDKTIERVPLPIS